MSEHEKFVNDSGPQFVDIDELGPEQHKLMYGNGGSGKSVMAKDFDQKTSRNG